MKKKSFFAILISILVFAGGIVGTIFLIRGNTWIGIPFVWIVTLGVWAEAINIIVHDYK